MTDFVISEDELDALDNMDQNDFIIDVLERIHSRKLSDELKKERERVLDKAIGLIREREINSENPKGWLWRNESLVALLDSLRGEP